MSGKTIKVRDQTTLRVLVEIHVTDPEYRLLADSGFRVDDSVALQRIFERIWYAGVARGRAYDPREHRVQDPMGLVGPSDSEAIGYPWCPWCRSHSHFGKCKES